MQKPAAPSLACFLGLLAIHAAASGADAAITSVRIEIGLDRPVFAVSPPGDTERLFIVEQHTGRIRILDLDDDSLLESDFLTVGDLATGDEQGLLGLAFHPSYSSNGFFYVNVTAADGDTEIRRYEVSEADPDVADPSSLQLVLSFDQPQENHNGGWIGFGPDNFLYIASGDGGGTNDDDAGHTAAIGNAQDITDNLLGKILRIDVNSDAFPADETRNYAIPPSNPFVGETGDDEIWAYGLRNPWRASFDRNTGRLYIGDVGQGAREEIDLILESSTGGENFGWRLREGTIQTPNAVGGAKPPGALDPIYDYERGTDEFEGFVVTGGYVYRGPIAEIQGRYFFADHASEQIWSFVYDGSAPQDFDGTNFTELTNQTSALEPGDSEINAISSFGEDDAGNLYILDLTGEIFRVVEVGGPTTTTTLPPPDGCGDPVSPEGVTASDALVVLKTSVGTESCVLCICDVNDSGSVTASDALAVLRRAVGQNVVLDCPTCNM